MYRLVFFLFQGLSLLPMSFFHALSELAVLLLSKVIRYRREVLEQNIRTVFPNHSSKEVNQLINQFYRNFADTFTESIKLLSLSNAQIDKRCTIDFALVRQLMQEGKSVQLMAAHQFNWEYVNQVIPSQIPGPYYFVYRTIQSPIFNQLFLFLRSRQGGKPIVAEAFAAARDQIFAQPAALILGADQNPSFPERALWIDFFGKATPFHPGPAKGAIAKNAAMVMLNLTRKKRGYYHLDATLIARDCATYTPEQLTWLYKKETERLILENPSNYLWSHRRWRHQWQLAYGPVYKGE
ncbi:MAG: lysophospholipid acyltransferase family protein [Bacteroidota bacterium]